MVPPSLLDDAQSGVTILDPAPCKPRQDGLWSWVLEKRGHFGRARTTFERCEVKKLSSRGEEAGSGIQPFVCLDQGCIRGRPSPTCNHQVEWRRRGHLVPRSNTLHRSPKCLAPPAGARPSETPAAALDQTQRAVRWPQFSCSCDLARHRISVKIARLAARVAARLTVEAAEYQGVVGLDLFVPSNPGEDHLWSPAKAREVVMADRAHRDQEVTIHRRTVQAKGNPRSKFADSQQFFSDSAVVFNDTDSPRKGTEKPSESLSSNMRMGSARNEDRDVFVVDASSLQVAEDLRKN